MTTPSTRSQGGGRPARPRLRVALVQATGQVGRAAANLAHLEDCAARARELGADLLVTPELFTAGYDPRAVAHQDGAEARDRLAALARRHGLAMVVSTVEHAGGARHISASLLGADGTELTRYRKSHLFGGDEAAVFTPGAAAPEVVEVGGVRIALGICFDVEFPEFVRGAALAGAELLCVPTAVPVRPDRAGDAHPFDARLVPAMVVPTRALESQLFVAYADHAGPGFAGLSTLADPYGRRIALAGDDPALIWADLDLAVLDQARSDLDYLGPLRRASPRKDAP